MKISVFLICMLEILILCGSAMRSESQNAPAEITKQYAMIVQSYKRKDIDGIVSYLAPDFTYHAKDSSTLTRDRIRQAFAQQLAHVSAVSEAKVSIVNSAVKNGATNVTVKLTVVTLPEAQESASSNSVEDADQRFASGGKKVVHRVVSTALQVDTWRKTSKGWRVTHTEALSREVKMEGVVASPPVHKR